MFRKSGVLFVKHKQETFTKTEVLERSKKKQSNSSCFSAASQDQAFGEENCPNQNIIIPLIKNVHTSAVRSLSNENVKTQLTQCPDANPYPKAMFAHQRPET